MPGMVYEGSPDPYHSHRDHATGGAGSNATCSMLYLRPWEIPAEYPKEVKKARKVRREWGMNPHRMHCQPNALTN